VNEPVEVLDAAVDTLPLEPVSAPRLAGLIAVATGFGSAAALFGGPILVLANMVALGSFSVVGVVAFFSGNLREEKDSLGLARVGQATVGMWLAVAVIAYTWFRWGSSPPQTLGDAASNAAIAATIAVWWIGVFVTVRRAVVQQTPLVWSGRLGAMLSSGALAALLSLLGTAWIAQWADGRQLVAMAETVTEQRTTIGHWPDTLRQMPDSYLARGRIWYANDDSTVGVSYQMGLWETDIVFKIPNRGWARQSRHRRAIEEE